MDRTRRHSLHTDSSNYVITSLRSKIKAIEDVNGQRQDLMDPLRYGAVVQQEQILVNKKSRNVRKVYMSDHRYKIGWVVDWDLSTCMVCNAPFGWFLGRPKHHCRACGALVCHGCSPYVTTVPGLNEFGGSRVCINCFGLKPGTFGSPSALMNGQKVTLAPKDADTYSICSQSPTNSFSYHHSESFASTKSSTNPAAQNVTPNGSVRRPRTNKPRTGAGAGAAAMSIHDMSQIDFDREIDQYEREQLPLYEQDYIKMREFVPIDIYKTSQQRMIDQGLTPGVANRIWTHKALWLICTHKDDIKKIHLADFRGKYSPEGLDVRELRAIWYNLPQWDEHSTNPLEVSKAEWRSGFKSRMDNQVYKMAAGNLSEALKVNPVYEECELKHVYDPTVTLQTRYDRSASMHRNAIESPMDENPYNTAQRLQQQPQKIARGTVRNKTRAYLSNFDEAEEDFESWQGEDQYSEVPDDDDYLYEYEEGDSRLDEGVYDEQPPRRVNNNAAVSKKAAYAREKEGRYNQILDEINAEPVQDADLSDLDNDIEDEVTDPYNRPSGRAGPGYDAYDSMPPPSGGTSRHYRGELVSGSHSVRSASDHGSDNRSHGSFHYRAPGSAPSHAAHHTASHRDLNSSRQSSFSSATTPLTSNAAPPASTHVTSPYYARSPVNSQVNSRVNSRAHSPVPVTRATAAPAVVEPTTTRQSVGGGQGGTISPVPAQTARSPVPAHSIAVPAYAYNQPNSFVPKKSPVPTTVISPKLTSHNSPYFPASTSGSYDQQHAALNNNPHGYSARRLEREQARRVRSAEARALAESHDLQSDALAMENDGYDDQYDPQSPTSSLSSHNDSQSLPRAPAPETPTSQSVAHKVQSFAPFGGAGGKDRPAVTSSDASTDREVSVAPAAAALSTPPAVQQRTAAPALADNVGDSEQENSEDEDEGSNFISDDDMSFNTAEEINTPMLNHHSYQDRDHAPRTKARVNGQTTGRHHRNANTTRKPGAGPVPAFDFELTKENLFKFLLLGDAKGASSMLHMLRAADVPVSTVIAPEQASEIMIHSFQDSETLEQPEETLVVLLDKLHAEVNHVDSDTGKTLLHHMVESNNVHLGSVLISRGADILQEDRAAVSPLVLNFQQKEEWVLEAFHSSGQQNALLQSGDTDRILHFATQLIYAGHSQQASSVIQEGGLQISAEKASQLLASCRNNFQNMKDPIETFELLESLGASVEE